MSPGPLTVRAALAVVLLALAGLPAPARADQNKPSAGELLRAYPLETTATPTATAAQATPTATATTAPPARAAATAAPAEDGGGGAPLLPIVLAVLVAAGAGGLVVARRRRRPVTAELAPPAAASPVRSAERLRHAADIRRTREWPWPAGSEELWRCEIAPDAASLSAHFRAVVHPPGGAPPVVVAESTAPPARAEDWQSSAPLEQAVDSLARELEARGWEPVAAGGDPHVRRFCRRTPPDIKAEEKAWTAHRS